MFGMGRRRQEWRSSLDVPRRPWTRKERKVVLRGFFGRLVIAIEPLFIAGFFALLPIGLWLRHQEAVLLLAPIFAVASLAFLAYAIVFVAPSARALLATFAPIYTVDGYIRYRSSPDGEPEYYVAALGADRRTLGEWPLREWPHSIGTRNVWPVVVEFSRYGGIHKIDGHSTGVLPDEIAPFGVGIARDEENKGRKFG
jgi:hypothetical protein